jgi:hypothetical protein
LRDPQYPTYEDDDGLHAGMRREPNHSVFVHHAGRLLLSGTHEVIELTTPFAAVRESGFGPQPKYM